MLKNGEQNPQHSNLKSFKEKSIYRQFFRLTTILR